MALDWAGAEEKLWTVPLPSLGRNNWSPIHSRPPHCLTQKTIGVSSRIIGGGLEDSVCRCFTRGYAGVEVESWQRDAMGSGGLLLLLDQSTISGEERRQQRLHLAYTGQHQHQLDVGGNRVLGLPHASPHPATV